MFDYLCSYLDYVCTAIFCHCNMLKSWLKRNIKIFAWSLYFLFVPDSSMYAHFLFEAFDTHNNGAVSFEVTHQLFTSQSCL